MRGISTAQWREFSFYAAFFFFVTAKGYANFLEQFPEHGNPPYA